ncbi:MAG: hypothetical protein KDA27_17780 [Candidatus Eisenbacteria bacterium]|uniref:Uncharacterized protein n=1 Tax=Eiseniibacteriota bacterium TaxID=2212470 RepID=A0A956NEV2_UNCEI|nr:hypothetical protein [Candidatus Eisenbacteria bacterium]MCB9465523.1 hypothetical protein [Candidatus Eisenbacteria bacterium]
MNLQPNKTNHDTSSAPAPSNNLGSARGRALRSPSTREVLAGVLGSFLVGGLVASIPAQAGTSHLESAGVATGTDDRPMMHAAFYQDYAASDAPTVIISDLETWTEYRKKTDRTYVDEKGETQPLYKLLKPAEGHVYLRVVADVSTDVPRSYETDQLLLVSGPSDTERWESAPLATFDAQGLPQVGVVTAPAEKVELDLLYEVPAGTWHDYYIEIGDRWYGPLDRYLDPVPANEDAADAGPMMEQMRRNEVTNR